MSGGMAGVDLEHGLSVLFARDGVHGFPGKAVGLVPMGLIVVDYEFGSQRFEFNVMAGSVLDAVESGMVDLKEWAPLGYVAIHKRVELDVTDPIWRTVAEDLAVSVRAEATEASAIFTVERGAVLAALPTPAEDV